MSNYLKKEARLFASYSPKQKSVSLLHSIYSALLFIMLSFAMFESLYVFCNFVGSIVSGSADVAIRDMIRMLPLLFFTCILAFCSFSIVKVDGETSQARRNKRLKRNSIELIVAGALLAIYVFVLFFIKKYSSLVEGYPTKLYPLDMAIFGVLSILLGVIGLLCHKKHAHGEEYVLPYHNKHKGAVRNGFDKVFYCLFLLGAAYSFAAVIHSFFIIDWSHGHTFYAIMLDLLFLDCVFNFVAYRYIYLGVKDENKADAEGYIGFAMFIQGILVYALYMVAFSLDLEAPNLACTGLLPVEYTASFNAATFLYILFDIVPGLVAMLKSFPDRKKLQKASKAK